MQGSKRSTDTLLAALLAAFTLSSCLADLRPAELREHAPEAADQERGRELLEQLAERHGGARRRAQLGAAEVVLRDEWQGFIGWWSNPWPQAENHLSLRYAADGSWSEATFLEGKRSGETWGLDPEGGWEREPEGEREACDSGSRRFILAAYPYLFELPFRLLDAPLVTYAGEREHEGRVYDTLLVTWGEFEAHGTDDQYLLWVERESGRLALAQYTIRDKLRWVTGADHLSDYREVDGILVPFRHTISMKAWDLDYVHRVELESVRYRVRHFFSTRPPRQSVSKESV